MISKKQEQQSAKRTMAEMAVPAFILCDSF
jgi:hypothetical protein